MFPILTGIMVIHLPNSPTCILKICVSDANYTSFKKYVIIGLQSKDFFSTENVAFSGGKNRINM